jgi:hypothetical protein
VETIRRVCCLRAVAVAAGRTAAGGGDATDWGVGATAAGNEVRGVDVEVDEPLGFGCALGAGSGCNAGGGGGAGSGPGPSASARPSKPASTATQRPRATVAERSAVNSSDLQPSRDQDDNRDDRG